MFVLFVAIPRFQHRRWKSRGNLWNIICFAKIAGPRHEYQNVSIGIKASLPNDIYWFNLWCLFDWFAECYFVSNRSERGSRESDWDTLFKLRRLNFFSTGSSFPQNILPIISSSLVMKGGGCNFRTLVEKHRSKFS